jgi:hypothetical protein
VLASAVPGGSALQNPALGLIPREDASEQPVVGPLAEKIIQCKSRIRGRQCAEPSRHRVPTKAAKILIHSAEARAGRTTVIIVREPVGV